ncbi:hypothetical protein ONZ45_g7299 [Pleurotus djamor]|nr:hypothetical protein ONZ45_g7299 [Pleurotus djamor]
MDTTTPGVDGKDPLLIYVSWPNAPLTHALVTKAIASLGGNIQITPTLPFSTPGKLIQWSTYDDIDHELTHTQPNRVFSSSYTIRKALIRKHFLSRCISNYLVKHPESPLRDQIPRTWDFELSYADDLDELWADELWDLGQELDEGEDTWWILKPGMADRGMGIRLFNSKESLYDIFQSFEHDSDDENDEDEATAVTTSQLRHFVIQEYQSSPLLVDPNQVLRDSETPSPELRGHKFHLRAYCVCSGSIEVFLYTRVLALFSAQPYVYPPVMTNQKVDLSPHLTNTSLQVHRGEDGVRLFEELRGFSILSDEPNASAPRTLTEEDIADIVQQMSAILAETFKAGIENPVHFQPLPNAFELYGIDFLVEHMPGSPRFQTKLLEINAEPAIELTGPRLHWILEGLFNGIAEQLHLENDQNGTQLTKRKLVRRINHLSQPNAERKLGLRHPRVTIGPHQSLLLRHVLKQHSTASVYSYERLNQIEEGSYGVVFRARDKQTGDIVALKKLKLDEEKNGFPITALREINALMSCRHENVVGIREVVVGDTLTQVFVVMDFIEHDLKTLLTLMPSPFLQSEIKTLMLQLLSAVQHCHNNWILHRDLKTSNLLMNNRGTIKVADFGLARRYGDPVGVGGMTQLVVTLWYRAPEILLGAKTYSTAIDMWSVGCIFAELLMKEPLFQAKGEIELLAMIFKLLGPPTHMSWPDYTSLPLAKTLSLPSPQPPQFRQKFPHLTSAGIDLMMAMLSYDPEQRITAEEALQHPYFSESPLPKHPDLFGSFPSAAAGEKKRRVFDSPSAPVRAADYNILTEFEV